MALHVGGMHSSSSSLTSDTGGEQLEVAVATIDALVAELNLSRVDFIKLDIEGAEREALKGAAVTLKKHHPRIMIDTYHRANDLVVLPQLIAQAQLDYEGQCGWCELRGEGRIVPHNVVYDSASALLSRPKRFGVPEVRIRWVQRRGFIYAGQLHLRMARSLSLSLLTGVSQVDVKVYQER